MAAASARLASCVQWATSGGQGAELLKASHPKCLNPLGSFSSDIVRSGTGSMSGLKPPTYGYMSTVGSFSADVVRSGTGSMSGLKPPSCECCGALMSVLVKDWGACFVR